MPEFQTAYSHQKHIGTINDLPSKTKQSLLDDADINKIVKRHMATETLQELDKLEKVYGQITSTNLMDAYRQIDDAQAAFNDIPSGIRKKFDQDAGAFIDYATDPKNIDQMVKWGLAINPPAPSKETVTETKTETKTE